MGKNFVQSVVFVFGEMQMRLIPPPFLTISKWFDVEFQLEKVEAAQ